MRTEKACLEFVSGGKSRRYTVQFNPAELSFEAIPAEKEAAKTEHNEKVNFQISEERVPEPILARKPAAMDITMSVNLILDQSLDSAASVQREAEGFVAAARKADLKEVVFQWDRLNFTGKLEQVSAEYTMFHESGAPARATVRMTLRNQGSRELGPFYEEEYNKLLQRGHI